MTNLADLAIPADHRHRAAWIAMLAVVRRAAAESRVIPDAFALIREAGLSDADSPSRKRLTAMIRAGLLRADRNSVGGIRYAIPAENIATPWSRDTGERRADRMRAHILAAIEADKPVATFAELAAAAGVRGGASHGLVQRAVQRGELMRETRRRPDNGIEVRWGIGGDDRRTPWTLLQAGRRTSAIVNGGKAERKPRDRRKDAAPAKPASAAPALPPPPKPGLEGWDLYRASSMRARIHTLRMQHARQQSEAELRATIDAYIARHGVTRITPDRLPDAGALPVGGTARRSMGDGCYRRGRG